MIGKTLIRALVCAGLLIGSAPALAAEEGVLPASPIPADARLIFSSTRAGEKDQWGMGINALYAASLDGKVTRLTNSRFFHNHFAVAPNRRWIATNRYSRGDSNKDGQYFPLNDYKELWVVDTRTGKERRIVPEIDAGWGGLAWSPDSKWIYFSSPSGKQIMDLRRVNIETSKVEVLTGGLNRLLGFDAPQKFVSDLDVSADGQWIVFLYTDPAAVTGQKPGSPRIAVMRVDGTAAHIVTDGGPLPPQKRGVWSVGDFDPAFSPDGRQITFARVTDVGMVSKTLSTWEINVVNTDGTGLKSISPPRDLSAEFIPGWSDQGIVFTRLDPKAASPMLPIIYDPKTGTRTPVPVGGEASHVQWIPSGGK